ncbi:MAG: hypothetical protein E6Q25_05725 [Acinetobacter sp.]|nr:MAG: hypothetical protein E6Q25_05725 [Acinetobacter sp.]
MKRKHKIELAFGLLLLLLVLYMLMWVFHGFPTGQSSHVAELAASSVQPQCQVRHEQEVCS